MSVEVHRADPKIRRLAPMWLIGTIAVGAAAVWALHVWLKSRPTSAAEIEVDGLMYAMVGLVALLATVSLGLAYALWQEAARIRREDRFPPSDMRTVRDVPVRHGLPARQAALWMRCGAVLSAGAGLGILAWGIRMVQLIA